MNIQNILEQGQLCSDWKEACSIVWSIRDLMKNQMNLLTNEQVKALKDVHYMLICKFNIVG